MMEKFNLSNTNIDAAVETVDSFLRKNKVASKDSIRTRLALEETLLNYRDKFGEEAEASLCCVRRFGRLRIELTVTGDSFNPFASEDESDFSRLLLSGIGMAPVWQYKNGQNIVTVTPKKKKPSQMVYLLAAVVLALAGGGLSSFLPENVQSFISLQLLTPVFDTLLGLLNAVAGIMIFLSVAWGICSIGDTATLGTIGKRMVGRMLSMMLLLSTVFAAGILPLFRFEGGTGGSSFDLSGPFEMLLGIIPSNMLAPFTEGNFLQIIFIAAIVGIALLVLGNKTPMITSFIEQANTMIQLIMETICSFVSLIIFISIYNMILGGSFSVLLKAYKAPLLILAGCVFLMLCYLAIVAIRKKIKPTVLLSKLMPTFLIGLTTASSSAAFATNMEACEKDLGIDRRIVNFGVPLGQIMFGIASITEFLVLAFCMAEIYGVPVTPAWLFMALVTSLMLTVATPPIPGGGVALCTLLFSQLGIPLEALAVAVAIDVIADFVITATNLFCLQTELVELSGSLDMLDLNTLCKTKALSKRINNRRTKS